MSNTANDKTLERLERKMKRQQEKKLVKVTACEVNDAFCMLHRGSVVACFLCRRRMCFSCGTRWPVKHYGSPFVCHDCMLTQPDGRQGVLRHLARLSSGRTTLERCRGGPPLRVMPRRPAAARTTLPAPARARKAPPALLELLGYGADQH